MKKNKRTKQLQAMVDMANSYLKANHVRDEHGDEVFQFVSYVLLRTNTYNGYNLYTAEGKLSGGVNTDHVQFY